MPQWSDCLIGYIDATMVCQASVKPKKKMSILVRTVLSVNKKKLKCFLVEKRVI
jgi:hypothetical protein